MAGGRIYVGTRDGHVLGFGSPVAPTVTGPATVFGNTELGDTAQRTVTLHAERDLTITGMSSSSPRFGAGAATPAAGTPLSAGDEVSVPVSFTPQQSGPAAASLLVETSAGPASFSLTGMGLSPEAELHASPPIVSFGGSVVGRGTLSSSVTLSNFGAQPLRIDSMEPPGAPFSAEAVPVGTTIAPGNSIDVSVSFAPTQQGRFTDELGLETSAGDEEVGLSGSASPPGRLQVSPAALDLGDVPLGQERAGSIELSNPGAGPLTIMKSKPPAFGPFAALWGLPEGTTIPAGGKWTIAVTFRPEAAGVASDRWTVTADDDQGVRDIVVRGRGTTPASGGSGLRPAASVPARLRVLSLALSHTRLRTARSHARLPRSARVRYRLSAPATLRLTVRHAMRRNERTVWAAVPGVLIHRARSASGSLALQSRMGGHALRPGRYRLTVSAVGAGGRASATRAFAVIG